MIRYLDPAILHDNMVQAVGAFPDRTSARGTKVRFLDVATSLQGVRLKYVEDDYIVDFECGPVLDVLRHHKVLVRDDLKERSFFGADEAAAIKKHFSAANQLIERAAPHLLALIRRLIGTYAIYDIRNRDIEGGSVSGCIGMVYLCPDSSWDTEFLAEMMVHEYVHNALFLDDMVAGIFPDLLLLKDKEAQVTSSVRRTRREYDKSFHAACVSSALAYFYHQLGNSEKSRQFLDPLDLTVRELNEVDQRLLDRGDNVITDVARGIKKDLTDFMRDRDFSRLWH